MKKFEFSSQQHDRPPVFDGNLFYNIYKDSHFLRHSENIETILSKGHELRIMLKDVEPGQMVAVSNMMLAENTPLLVKKTGPNVTVEAFEFTANRLSGLVAAYAFDNRSSLPDLKSTEALSLGLIWDNQDERKCRLYLSAVSGTEHFANQFHFWPLVCGLRKLEMNKITLQPIIKMAKIKNPDGLRMGNLLMRNLVVVSHLWSNFPGASNINFNRQIRSLPPELKKLFFNMK